MTDVSLRFPGAADATAASVYKIERTLNNTAWTVLAAAQAATAPYAPASTVLASSVNYRGTTVDLVNAANVSSSGYGYLDGEALIQWTGKSTNQLTGVTWLSGYGAYLAGSPFVQAHEAYADNGITVDQGIALYRITHINAAGVESAPAYLPFFVPPRPASSRHCVVVVNLATDLGVEPRSGINVTCQLAANDQLINATGEQLGQGKSANKTQATNGFGLTFFQCWKNVGRVTKGGAAAKGYTFQLETLTVTATTIPDQDWVLLEDIADA